MRDHNSPTTAMRGITTAFLTDVSTLTGIDTSKDIRRVNALLDRSAILNYLNKHHLVLLGFFKTGRLVAKDVKHDGMYPVFLRELWVGLADGDPQCASLLRQATCLFRKWSEDIVPPGQSTEAFKTRMLAKNRLPISLVDEIALELPALIGDIDLDPKELLLPKITSGARAERTPVLVRLDHIQTWSESKYAHSGSSEPLSVLSPQINRLVEVPKDWTKNRLVCAEPSPSMNLQQCLRTWIEERVSRSKAGRSHISFDDQGFQHKRLREDGVSTIDLSDASDWVTAPLIWRFLRKYPRLRAALFAARSRSTRIGDDVVGLRCFGTMGNATTFTVMTLFLAALSRVCEYEVVAKGHVVRRTRVFGDDIICDDAVAGGVLCLLDRCGLKVNRAKTYIAGAFKESCGVDIFRDVDITPVYIKRIHIAQPAEYSRVVSQSNALHKALLWNTARALLSFSGLRDCPVNTNSEAALFSFSDGCETVCHVWHADEQRWLTWIEDSCLRAARRQRTRRRDSNLDLQYALCWGSRVSDRVTR